MSRKGFLKCHCIPSQWIEENFIALHSGILFLCWLGVSICTTFVESTVQCAVCCHLLHSPLIFASGFWTGQIGDAPLSSLCLGMGIQQHCGLRLWQKDRGLWERRTCDPNLWLQSRCFREGVHCCSRQSRGPISSNWQFWQVWCSRMEQGKSLMCRANHSWLLILSLISQAESAELEPSSQCMGGSQAQGNFSSIYHHSLGLETGWFTTLCGVFPSP